MRRRALVALGAVLLACGRPVSEPEVVPSDGEVAVQVENHFTASLTIHLHSQGISRRLGEVHFQETRAFVVPWRRIGSAGVFRLRAEVIGSDERVVTDNLRVQPGQVVHWTLTPHLDASSVILY
jgi:hypothetical protein